MVTQLDMKVITTVSHVWSHRRYEIFPSSPVINEELRVLETELVPVLWLKVRLVNWERSCPRKVMFFFSDTVRWTKPTTLSHFKERSPFTRPKISRTPKNFNATSLMGFKECVLYYAQQCPHTFIKRVIHRCMCEISFSQSAEGVFFLLFFTIQK